MPESIQLEGQVGVGHLPDGRSLLSIDTGNGRVYTLTLEEESAKSIGGALLAPTVALPGNGATARVPPDTSDPDNY